MIEAINAGIGAATSIINPILQHNQNIRNRKYALQDRDYQNEYNSPKAQMARLKDAGLNPNLVYGNGNAVAQSTPVRSEGQAPQVNSQPLQNALYQWQDYALKEARLNQLEKLTKLADENTRLARQRTESAALKYSLDSSLFQVDKTMREELLRKRRLENTGQGYRNQLALQEWEIKDIMKQPNLDKVIQDISLSKAREGMIPSQINQLKASADNLISSKEYRDLQADQLRMIKDDLHIMLLNNIGVAEGRKTLQESQKTINEVRASLMRAGLSQQFISDLFKLIPTK